MLKKSILALACACGTVFLIGSAVASPIHDTTVIQRSKILSVEADEYICRDSEGKIVSKTAIQGAECDWNLELPADYKSISVDYNFRIVNPFDKDERLGIDYSGSLFYTHRLAMIKGDLSDHQADTWIHYSQTWYEEMSDAVEIKIASREEHPTLFSLVYLGDSMWPNLSVLTDNEFFRSGAMPQAQLFQIQKV